MEETKRGRGRPEGTFKPNPRCKTIKIRLTEKEDRNIRLAAFAANKNVSDFIRLAVLAKVKM